MGVPARGRATSDGRPRRRARKRGASGSIARQQLATHLAPIQPRPIDAPVLGGAFVNDPATKDTVSTARSTTGLPPLLPAPPPAVHPTLPNIRPVPPVIVSSRASATSPTATTMTPSRHHPPSIAPSQRRESHQEHQPAGPAPAFPGYPTDRAYAPPTYGAYYHYQYQPGYANGHAPGYGHGHGHGNERHPPPQSYEQPMQPVAYPGYPHYHHNHPHPPPPPGSYGPPPLASQPSPAHFPSMPSLTGVMPGKSTLHSAIAPPQALPSTPSTPMAPVAFAHYEYYQPSPDGRQ